MEQHDEKQEGMLVVMLKRARPDATDAEIGTLIKEVRANPKSADAAVQAFISKSAPTQKVNVTGQRLPINSNLKSPWEGTSQEAANPDNPAASAISQFDPRALQAAQAEYKNYYDSNAGSRALTGMLAGAVSGYDPNSVARNSEMWKSKNAEKYLQTIGAQEALQKQSTEGLNAATTLQNMSKQAGEYEGNQKYKQEEINKLRRENEMGNLDLQARKDLNDPNSPQTMLAKQLLADQLRTAGNASPELLKMLQGPVTAQQLMAFMDPQVLKAFATKVGIASTQEDVKAKQLDNRMTETVQGKLGVGPAPAGSNVVPKDVQAERDRESLRIIKGEYDKEKDPANKAALFREIMRLENSLKNAGSAPAGSNELDKRLQFATIPAGKMSLPPDPRVVAGAANEADAAAKAEERFRMYDTQFAPTIQATKEVLARQKPGALTEPIARFLPGDNRELVNMFNRFNAIYPGTLGQVLGGEMAKSVDKGGFTGSIVSNLSGEQVKRMIELIESSAGRDRAYQGEINKRQDAGAVPGRTGAGMPMPNTTPAPKEIPRPKSKEEYDALPKGSEYIDPDGVKRRKP